MPDATPTPSRILVGIDEAGLGPLLGPLVIGTCVFKLEQDSSDDPLTAAEALWTALADGISNDPKQSGAKLVVCDSKKLHQSSKGVGRLESSVLPFFAAAHPEQQIPASFAELWKQGVAAPARALSAYPWYQKPVMELPQQASRAKCSIRAQQAARVMAGAGVALLDIHTLPVLAGEFNRLLHSQRNKANAHIACIAGELRALWSRHAQLEVLCDRLGGRVRYGPALKVLLDPVEIEVLEESPQRSRYLLTREAQSMDLSFLVSGDAKAFPIALASMAAKYLRELSMELLNAWFVTHQPKLKPTKGYYQDAKRFLADTHALRRELEVPDRLLIRER